ncbi:MAG TPA: carboxypeptidase-like regulatory domain-containing protein [Labilithrix sp.]|jgi:hypothetical protein|nr:carboxypeptidase-like regulatory domain-containing protein [Labilithrix sp.]
MRRLLVAGGAIALAGLSCVDPTHASGVDELGPETPGIPPGPLHRPGQPCLACHDGRGPGEPELSVAGTIYAARTESAPLVGARVTIQDATGTSHVLITNEAGNFYIEKSSWAPTYPLFVRLDFDGKKKLMQTRIGQNGGCGFCHSGPRPKGDPVHMPPVFLEDR